MPCRSCQILRFAAKPRTLRSTPSPGNIDCAADPNPHALHAFDRAVGLLDQRKRMAIKGQTIMAYVDAQCCGQSSRPGAQQFFNLGAAPDCHLFKADCRPQCTQQDGVAGIADHVHTPLQAITSVNITTACRAKHRSVAPRWARKAMRCRIIRLISLCLYNYPAHLPIRQKATDQVGGDFGCRARKKRGFYNHSLRLHDKITAWLLGSACSFP